MSVKVISFSNQITYLDDGNHLLLATFIQVWVNICFNFILHVFRVPEHSLNFNKKHHNKLLSKLILSWTELIERYGQRDLLLFKYSLHLIVHC